jgi:hypothetical protein
MVDSRQEVRGQGIVIRGRCVNKSMRRDDLRLGSRCSTLSAADGDCTVARHVTLSVSWQDDIDVGDPIRATRHECALVESVTPAALRPASVAAEKYKGRPRAPHITLLPARAGGSSANQRVLWRNV